MGKKNTRRMGEEHRAGLRCGWMMNKLLGEKWYSIWCENNWGSDSEGPLECLKIRIITGDRWMDRCNVRMLCADEIEKAGVEGRDGWVQGLGWPLGG